MTKIKICGLKNVEDAQVAVEAGANYLGFVFAKSKRQVTKEEAKVIIDSLPDTVKSVGVFVNTPLDDMMAIAKFCGLDLLQLHGDESFETYSNASLPIIKSVSIAPKQDTSNIELPDASYLLFDTWHKDMAGGSGESFDWTTLKTSSIKRPFFLAGGLTIENVREAIEEINPYAVDISSGVETNGVKDASKIKAFIKTVKECTHDL